MTAPDPRRPALPTFAPGSVWLTGAGPGDPGLLTLHALNGLDQADVIVHDALVAPEILALANPSARLEAAGKRGGRPSPTQDTISARLIQLAAQGMKVLRLKGGDPFVFGRGAEEGAALTAAGIPWRVIPGITAGLGGLAAAGIPATARETNRAIILATGHPAAGSDPGPDWAELAATGLPIVLYMAMTGLADITAGLMAGGLSPDTPVAFVADATTPAQRLLVTRLADAVTDATAAGIRAPAIVAIGGIVALRAVLAPTLRALSSPLDLEVTP